VRAKAGDFVFAPARHYHHIRPTGTGLTIRLAITPPGEFHRHDRPDGEGPTP
jgi:mannose-6-phosphate isomerase-like protein (cupin superfamily)